MTKQMGMTEAKEFLNMSEKEQDQYLAYCEEQERLRLLYEKQEHKKRIEEAIELLRNEGYLVTMYY
jgi:protein tyrosine phosphatase (PTP) superfamily phosphohydrolase (DUF442 family)